LLQAQQLLVYAKARSQEKYESSLHSSQAKSQKKNNSSPLFSFRYEAIVFLHSLLLAT
jgi:hypothetical protein